MTCDLACPYALIGGPFGCMACAAGNNASPTDGVEVMTEDLYWRFESMEHFSAMLSADAAEIVEGNSGMKTSDLIALMDHVGLEDMVFCGCDYGTGEIKFIDTIFIRKNKVDVMVVEFLSKYRPDESDSGGRWDHFEGSADFWRFWWD